MDAERRSTWTCQMCKNRLPKSNNQNTPLQGPHHLSVEQHSMTHSPSNNNVTMRKKTINTNNDTLSSDDTSILGDTFYQDKETLLLSKLNETIIQRLEENTKLIISELKKTIQFEIQKTIEQFKEEIYKKTDTLTKQQDIFKEDIQNINTELTRMQAENERLANEIKDLSSKISPSTHGMPHEIECIDVKSKKIVLYGFHELYNETEYDLHSRLIELFRELMHVDLTGYIENMYRIGKKTHSIRPLVVELLSKRMANYITNNSQCFQGTRFAISTFLNDKERKERQFLREEMIKARKKGMHAIIRNNQLIVDGKRVNMKNNGHENLQKNNTAYEPRENQPVNQDVKNTIQPETTNHLFRKHRPTI